LLHIIHLHIHVYSLLKCSQCLEFYCIIFIVSDNQGPVDNSNYLEPVDECIDQEPVNKGNDQEPVDTINEHGEIEKTNDKVPVISAEGVSLAVKALITERMEKKSINQVS
jgi:hypothetical protein